MNMQMNVIAYSVNLGNPSAGLELARGSEWPAG